MGETSGKKLPRYAAVIVIVITVFVCSALAIRSYTDSLLVQKITLVGEWPRVSSGTIPDDAQVISFNLDAIEQIRNDSLDAAALDMELPPLRRLLYKMGMRHLSLNDEAKRGLESILLSELKRMSGEDFGDDVSKWRKWQAAREEK